MPMAKRKSTKGQITSTNLKHRYKTKDRVTGTPLKTGGELRCSGRVSSCSCSTSGIRRIILVRKPVIRRECGKDREVFIQVEHIRGHL